MFDFDELIRYLADFIGQVVSLLFHYMDIAISNIIELAEPVILGLAEMIPGNWREFMPEVLGWVGYIDSWFPVVFAFSLVVIYWTLWINLNAVKWVLKAIPTIWG